MLLVYFCYRDVPAFITMIARRLSMSRFSFLKSRFLVCYCSAILGAVTYVTFTFLACELHPLPVSPFENWLSDLGDPIVNPAGAIFYNIGVMLSALFLA